MAGERELHGKVEQLLADADVASTSKTVWGQWLTTMHSPD